MTKKKKLLVTHNTYHKWLFVWLVLLIVGALVYGIIAFKRQTFVETQYPQAIMGTETQLLAVGPLKVARIATQDAEKKLRRVQALMDRHLDGSDISRLNSALAGQMVSVDQSLVELLKISREITRHSDGAFDPTCKPIIDLWKSSVKAQALPNRIQLAMALNNTGWDKFQIIDGTVVKNNSDASIDLGAIAKGYAIDLGVEAMKQAGATGGLVNVGGDIRCFGQKKNNEKWRVAVKNPFEKEKLWCILEFDAGAVCTSGNYERFFMIGSQKFNHIIDPKTARPAKTTASVTVVAPTAAIADAWATALSVLGTKGLEILKNTPQPPKIEAMIITGESNNPKVFYTKGFERLKAQH